MAIHSSHSTSSVKRILPSTTFDIDSEYCETYADVAQLVEHGSSKPEVEASNAFICSKAKVNLRYSSPDVN